MYLSIMKMIFLVAIALFSYKAIHDFITLSIVTWDWVISTLSFLATYLILSFYGYFDSKIFEESKLIHAVAKEICEKNSDMSHKKIVHLVAKETGLSKRKIKRRITNLRNVDSIEFMNEGY